MEQKIIWDYYQGLGEQSFQDASPRLKHLVKCARKMFPRNQPHPILNIGVGSGYLEQVASRYGFTPYSLDPSEVAIQRIHQNGGQGKIGYIEAIPYEAEAFSVIFCSEVIEHLTNHSLTKAMNEIWRTLKPGGYLIGTVPFREVLSANEVICPNCQAKFHRWGHEQAFDKASMRDLLQEARFNIARLETRAFPVFANKGLIRKSISAGRWIMGRLGVETAMPNLFFIARKL